MNSKRVYALLLVLTLCVTLCGCAKSPAASTTQSSARRTESAVPAPMAAPTADYAFLAGEYEASYDEAGFASTNASADAAKGDNGGSMPEENPEKIIYSGDATVETTDFDQTIAALEAMIAENGGFIESSAVNGSNYYDRSRGSASRRSASYTLRVPSERFSALMSNLSVIGNVPYTHTYTENVTAQYYDVQARLKALQAQEARLTEMLSIAETVEDIITIEDKLSDVRYRIDSLQSSLNNWDRRVAYSTLSVTVKEVQVYTPDTPVRVTYWQRLLSAFTDALEGVGTFFQDLLVFLVSCVPGLAVLAALFFLLRPAVRKLFARLRARRAARRAAKTAAPAKTVEGETVEE